MKFNEHMVAGGRGGKAMAARFTLLIEGENVTPQQVGERLGMDARRGSDRVRREQARSGPVTWAGLMLTNAQRKELDALEREA